MNYFKTLTILVMASFYILVGVDHFLRPEWYVRIVPPILPYKLALVYISGIFEIFFCGLLKNMNKVEKKRNIYELK